MVIKLPFCDFNVADFSIDSVAKFSAYTLCLTFKLRDNKSGFIYVFRQFVVICRSKFVTYSWSVHKPYSICPIFSVRVVSVNSLKYQQHTWENSTEQLCYVHARWDGRFIRCSGSHVTYGRCVATACLAAFLSRWFFSENHSNTTWKYRRHWVFNFWSLCSSGSSWKF